MLRLDVSSLRSQSSVVDESKSSVVEIPLTVRLPDDREFSYSLRSDLTIAYLKLALERDSNISWFRFELLLGDRLLADPLSLADVPEIQRNKRNFLQAKILQAEEDEENGAAEQMEEDMRRVGMNEDSGSGSDSEDD